MSNRKQRDRGRGGGNQRGRGPGRDNDRRPPRREGGRQPSWTDSQEGWERDYQPRRRGQGGSMRHMFLGGKADVTVVIRTYNAEEHLEELLDSIENQESPYEVEVIAIDAGSRDRTPIILRARGIRVHHVDEGKSFRKLAAKMAEGDAVIFLCQDALPLDRGWLYHMATPVIEQENVGVAHGRIIADASVPPYQRGLYNARPFASGKQPFAFASDDGSEASFFLPAANYAVARRLVRQANDLDAHDRLLVRQVYEAGLTKVYLPESAAIFRSGRWPTCLLEDTSDELPDKLGGAFSKETRRLCGELYQLNDGGDLPKGQRGEAYAVAFGLHIARIARHVYRQSALARKVADRITPVLKRKLGEG